MIHTPLLGELLFRFEEGDLNEEETINLFQIIYDSKAYTWLQGSYGRTLQNLIDNNYIQLKED